MSAPDGHRERPARSSSSCPGTTARPRPPGPASRSRPTLTTTEAYQSLGTAPTRGTRRVVDYGPSQQHELPGARPDDEADDGGCAAAIEIRIDHLRVRIRYDYTTTTSVFIPDTNLASPYGAALNPRGFWGTMLTQGAEYINGDAYSAVLQHAHDRRPTPTTAAHELLRLRRRDAAGRPSGQVWIYRPGARAPWRRTWAPATGTSGTRTPTAPTRSRRVYSLYDTKNTLYDTTDDGSP